MTNEANSVSKRYVEVDEVQSYCRAWVKEPQSLIPIGSLGSLHDGCVLLDTAQILTLADILKADEGLRERVAELLWDKNCHHTDMESWGCYSGVWKDLYRNQADAILAIIGEQA